MRHREYKFMKNREHHFMRNREHHPRISIGLFFIVLGLSLLVATNDLLNLGSISSYFTWQTAMVFIGILLLVNLHFTGGILMIAGGIWFFFENVYGIVPETIKTYYWPAIIILLGLVLMISNFTKRKTNI